MVDSADSHRKKKLTVKDVFNDDEDGVDENKKKRPLVPLGNYFSFQSREKLTVCSIPCVHKKYSDISKELE